MDTGSLGGTGWESEETELLFVQESSRSTWSSTLGWQMHMGDVVAGVCYRAHAQEKEVDKVSFRQLEEASLSHALALLGDFSHPDRCCSVNAAEHKQFRNFLDYTDDNFLTQPKRREALFLLILPQKHWLGI